MKIKMKNLYIIVIFIIISSVLSCHSQKYSEKPNVIIIYGDDIGIGDFSCYGSFHIKTPSIDRLATEGIIFHDAHSPNAFCSASRYSLLTGRYSWRSKVPELKTGIFLKAGAPFSIDPDRYTMADLFKSAGYKTACIGKWHLGVGKNDMKTKNWETSLDPGPNDVGFDYFFGLPGSNNYSPEVYMRNSMVVGERDNRKIAKVLTNEAVNFIKENKEIPFFLYFPTTNIHVPWTPDYEHNGKSDIGAYGDFVVEFDWIVGKVIDALLENGIYDNSIIIISSDNGAWAADDTYYNGKREESKMNERFRAIRDAGHFSNLIYQGNKGRLFEGGHIVPFIISWPEKIIHPSSNHSYVNQIDLFASFAELLNINIPEGMAEDSQSMMPFLNGELECGIIREEYVLVAKGKYSYRNGDWVYIDGPTNGTEVMGRGPVQLYNLRVDPSQRNNLAQDYPDRTREMKIKLDEILNK